MNRTEALDDFNKKIVNDLLLKYKREFKENFINNERKFALLLIDSIKKLNEKAIKNREVIENYSIGVLQFEFLRSNLLNDNFKIHLHGYNNLWYLDEHSIYEEIDLKFIFSPFIDLKKELIEKSKIYLGKINIYDIQKIIFDAAFNSYMEISQTVREYLWDLDEEEWIQDILFSDFYIIKWGEYKGNSETVFAMDSREKKAEDIEKLKKEKKSFIYSVWRKSTLENIDLSKEDLLFINFKESSLKNSDFSESNIISGELKDTKIQSCDFSKAKVIGTTLAKSIIKESDFKDCDLRSSDFNNTMIEEVEFDNSDLSIGNFVNSNLYKVSFKNCNLSNADFSKAQFEEVNFQGADLSNTIFSREDIPFLHLSPEQLQDILIEEGDEDELLHTKAR